MIDILAPPATKSSVPGKSGTQEPNSKVPGTNADPNAVFVNAALAPGRRRTWTPCHRISLPELPQVPIAAYRLRHLTDDQTREISSKLAGGALPTTSNWSALPQQPETETGAFPRRACAQTRTSCERRHGIDRAHHDCACRRTCHRRELGKVVLNDPTVLGAWKSRCSSRATRNSRYPRYPSGWARA